MTLMQVAGATPHPSSPSMPCAAAVVGVCLAEAQGSSVSRRDLGGPRCGLSGEAHSSRAPERGTGPPAMSPTVWSHSRGGMRHPVLSLDWASTDLLLGDLPGQDPGIMGRGLAALATRAVFHLASDLQHAPIILPAAVRGLTRPRAICALGITKAH